MNKRLAFIGCGNMGEALLKGAVSKNLFRKKNIIVYDTSSIRLGYIVKTYGVSKALSNRDAAKKGDIVIIAVKPQEISSVIQEISFAAIGKLVVSVAAGITTDYIGKGITSRRIVRAMPNMPALVGCGITAISYNKWISPDDKKIVDDIFSCNGEIIHIKERYMNAVTAVSGSGPAYFFLLIDAIIEAATSLGIEKNTAEKLVVQTALGAAVLKMHTGLPASALIERITSKKGTTAAAFSIFEKHNLRNIIIKAVKQAAQRAEALSK